MTFSRSRAFVYVRGTDEPAVLAGLSRLMRRWDFVRQDVRLDDYRSVSGHEIRALYSQSSSEESGWTTLAVEDLQNALETAYALSKTLENSPVIVSRAYQYGDWQLKGYVGAECVMKLGDDPDHELAWVGPKLTQERIPRVVEQLGVEPKFGAFLQAALMGEGGPDAFAKTLNLPSMREGFSELHSQSSPNWTFASWIHQSSRYAA